MKYKYYVGFVILFLYFGCYAGMAEALKLYESQGYRDFNKLQTIPKTLQRPIISTATSVNGEIIQNPAGERVGKIGADYIEYISLWPVTDVYSATKQNRTHVFIFCGGAIFNFCDTPAELKHLGKFLGDAMFFKIEKQIKFIFK